MGDVPLLQSKQHYDTSGTLISDTVTYLQVDHLNTPRLGTQGTPGASDFGAVVWRWSDADPFGEALPDEGDARATHRFRAVAESWSGARKPLAWRHGRNRGLREVADVAGDDGVAAARDRACGHAGVLEVVESEAMGKLHCSRVEADQHETFTEVPKQQQRIVFADDLSHDVVERRVAAERQGPNVFAGNHGFEAGT